jgi:hypothetical protein
MSATLAATMFLCVWNHNPAGAVGCEKMNAYVCQALADTLNREKPPTVTARCLPEGAPARDTARDTAYYCVWAKNGNDCWETTSEDCVDTLDTAKVMPNTLTQCLTHVPGYAKWHRTPIPYFRPKD